MPASAARSSRRLRVARAASLSTQLGDAGLVQLHGMVDAVARDDGVPVGAVELHGDMARSVAGGGQQVDSGGHFGSGARHVDQVEQPGVADRVDGVAVHLFAGFLHVRTCPVVPFGTGRQIAGVREGGDPTPAVVNGVPADMALAGDPDGGNAGRCSAYAVEQVETILHRAVRRGEHVPDTDTVMDHVVAPMMYRVLFRPGLLDAHYARGLVATVFYRLMPLP